VLLLSLNTDAAAKVFRNLDEDQVEEILVTISELKDVSPEMRQSIFEECRDALASGADFAGLDKAKSILNQALGEEKAMDVLGRVGESTAGPGGNAFTLLKHLDVQQAVSFLQKEHPQTIAVVLSHVDAEHSAKLLSALPEELQGTVAERIANLSNISPDVIGEIAGEIERRFAGQTKRRGRATDGKEAIATILNNVDVESEKRILGILDERAPELSNEVRKRMFVFEDLAKIDRTSMQRVMKEVDMSDVTLALKVANEETKEAIFAGISKRGREMVLEELEYLGPVRLKDVEEAQQRVIDAVRGLEESGEIVIPGRGGSGGDQIIE